MVFYSRITNFTAIVRHEGIPRHPTTGDLMPDQKIPRITAEFGQHLGEFEYVDPLTGGREIGAEIRGHYFDTVAAQQANNWSDDEREMVERRLLYLCETQPEFVELYSEPAVTAPWPTYDTLTNYMKIAALADELGLIAETIAYERQNKNRDGVLKALEEKLADQRAEADLVAA